MVGPVGLSVNRTILPSVQHMRKRDVMKKRKSGYYVVTSSPV